MGLWAWDISLPSNEQPIQWDLSAYSRNIFSGFMLNSIPCSDEACMSVDFSHIPVFSVPDFTEEGSKSFCWDMGSGAHRPVALWLLPGHLLVTRDLHSHWSWSHLSLLCVTKVLFQQYLLSWVFFVTFFFFADFVIPKMQETLTPSWWLVLWMILLLFSMPSWSPTSSSVHCVLLSIKLCCKRI